MKKQGDGPSDVLLFQKLDKTKQSVSQKLQNTAIFFFVFTCEEDQMAWRYCYRDVLPFTAMVSMECVNVGLNTLFKAATLQGMSYHVFIVYAYAIAALVLLPAPFFSYRQVFFISFLTKFIISFNCWSFSFDLFTDREFFLHSPSLYCVKLVF